MKKKFIKFLKDNNALIPFICNLATSNNNNAKKAKGCLYKYINATSTIPEPGKHYSSAEMLIEKAFDWHTTPEKSTYWDNLEDLWLEI